MIIGKPIINIYQNIQNIINIHTLTGLNTDKDITPHGTYFSSAD